MGRDKLGLGRDGRTLAEIAVAALLEVCERVVVSSPERIELSSPRVAFVLEDPPFGGPAAGVAAAVGALKGEDANLEVYLLAGDLAAPERVVAELRAAPLGVDGSVLVDVEGWPQYLAGRYRLGSLRRALSGEVRDSSVRRMLRNLELTLIPAGPQVTADIDTPEQARQAGLL